MFQTDSSKRGRTHDDATMALSELGSDLKRMRHHVCGLDIELNTEFDQKLYTYPLLASCVMAKHNTHTDGQIFSTLLPKVAEVVCLITNQDAYTYVYLPRLDGVSVSLCRPAYQAANIIGANSVFHGFMYLDGQGQTRIGLCDASKINGVSTRHLTPEERHRAVHNRIWDACAQDSEDMLRYHWCGYESTCMRARTRHNSQFAVQCLVRVPVHLDGAETIQRVLSGIDVC